ncbi:MAG: 4Fe-4S dicluster-binding protein [Dehalococcoidia bacterium]
MATASVEVVYRGIFQKTLAQRICRGIVLAARKESKIGIAFGRYGDSPERNGIPAKQFAVVADDQEELEGYLARYEPDNNDVTVVLDDTLCKGVESWAWYGLQPITRLLKPGGVLLATSLLEPGDLIPLIHAREHDYSLAVVKGGASFSGLWVYKDDHTDVRVLGALAKAAPHIVSLDSIQQAVRQEWPDDLKLKSAQLSHQRVLTRRVEPGEGSQGETYSFELPKWYEMKEGIAIPAIAARGDTPGWSGGYRPGRNPTFRKFSTRTMRPVVDFDKCIKCTLCWLQCPDSCFDVTPEGLYDASMEACCGCGICEAVCPVEDCIVMVNEEEFADNASQYEMWQKDHDGYNQWAHEKMALSRSRGRSHGFARRGQYQAEKQRILEEVTGGQT